MFEKRLEVATKQMNTEEKLAGYANTMDFVNELKKYIKITKVCDSNDLSKCFESKILTADGQEVEAYNLKTSAQMAVDDWGTETVGVQFANGINALIAYNPNTDQQPFNNQFSATEASMAILYDVSGHKNPNTLGKDVNQNANVTNLGCRINPDLVGGMCITKILAPGTGFSPMTSLECTSLRLAEEELGITTCFSFVGATEYWAAAVKACGGVNKMPSPEQLTELAKYIYNTDMIPSDGNINNLVMDPEKAAPFLAVTPMASKTSFYAWANQHYADKARYASSRFYGDSSTFWENESSRDARNRIAICTDN